MIIYDTPVGIVELAQWAPRPQQPEVAHYWTADLDILFWQSACGIIGHGPPAEIAFPGNWQPEEDEGGMLKRCAACLRALEEGDCENA